MGGVIVHFYVWHDDIWQLLDETEQGWHATDGTSRRSSQRASETIGGNLDTIAIESIGADPETEATTAKLTAYLLQAHNLNVDTDVYSHYYFYSAKTCPVYILPHWSSFMSAIKKYYTADTKPSSSTDGTLTVGDIVTFLGGDVYASSTATVASGKRETRSIQKLVRQLGERAGISKRVHPHVLRHTLATDLLSAGMDITIIIAPKYISGSAPKLSDKKIFWQGREMDYDTINLKYSISHKRAAGIIQGTGLYGSYSSKKAIIGPDIPNKELVFICELVQNAMDATKIQVFRYLKENRYGDALLELGNKSSMWNPVAVMNNIGDFIERLKIEVKICYELDVLRTGSNKRRPNLKIKVKDVGTGIDDKSLKDMSMIGDTRNRALLLEIKQMPEWLRPNGSFGIGMQSIFGIVEEFRAVSGSRTDHKVRDLFFRSFENSGDLFAAERAHNNSYSYGTTVSVEMDETEIERIYSTIIYDNGIFDGSNKTIPYMGFSCDFLFSELNKQINKMLGQDLFPVEIKFYVNDIEINQYEIRREGIFTELVELDRHLNRDYSTSD